MSQNGKTANKQPQNCDLYVYFIIQRADTDLKRFQSFAAQSVLYPNYKKFS